MQSINLMSWLLHYITTALLKRPTKAVIRHILFICNGTEYKNSYVNNNRSRQSIGQSFTYI